MLTKEVILEILNEASDEAAGQFPNTISITEYVRKTRTRTFELAADALLEAAAPKWISVKNPPGNAHIYLIARKYGNRTLGWYDGAIWFTGYKFTPDDTVTHYMALPEPPPQ